jgi:hypothetical protein
VEWPDNGDARRCRARALPPTQPALIWKQNCGRALRQALQCRRLSRTDRNRHCKQQTLQALDDCWGFVIRAIAHPLTFLSNQTGGGAKCATVHTSRLCRAIFSILGQQLGETWAQHRGKSRGKLTYRSWLYATAGRTLPSSFGAKASCGRSAVQLHERPTRQPMCQRTFRPQFS